MTRSRLTITPSTTVEIFYCKTKRKSLTAETCLNNYSDANALKKIRSGCFCCMQGFRIRELFAEEGDVIIREMTNEFFGGFSSSCGHGTFDEFPVAR